MDPQPTPGQPIATVIPELIGSEGDLQAILDGEQPQFRLPLINRNGDRGADDDQQREQKTNYINITILPHRHDSGQPISGLFVFIEDATEEGKIQQRIMQQRNELTLLRDALARQNRQLQVANAELQQLSKLKSRFVAVAAHELRTPLTTISGYTELLDDGSFGPLNMQQRRPLEIITQSSERLLLIINNLLDISRIETGRMQLDLRPVTLEALVHRCLDEQRLHLDERRQSIILDLPDKTPVLLCDKDRTIQILCNLVGNASKYTPDGGAVTLSVTDAEEEGYLQITITDTGIGIPLTEQKHIFDTFYRASNVNEVSTTGAGLGLHITRSLVELQGGKIRCKSAPGQGASFIFTLPLAG